MTITEKENHVYKIIKRANDCGFVFPEKNTKLIYIYLRKWLEDQDIFIHIRKISYSPMPKYLYEINLVHRKISPTEIESSLTPDTALKKAIEYVLAQDIFAGKKN